MKASGGCVRLELFTGECFFVENGFLAARDQSRMSLDAGDQVASVSGNGEPRERPEAGRLGIDLGRASETDDG